MPVVSSSAANGNNQALRHEEHQTDSESHDPEDQPV
jgi:hypothetical protein